MPEVGAGSSMIDQNSQRSPLALVVAAFDVVVGAGSLYLAYLIRVKVLVAFPEIWRGSPALMPSYAILALATIPMLVAALYISGAYSLPRMRSFLGSLAAIGRAMTLSLIGVLAFAYVLRDQTYSRAIVALFLLLAGIGFLIVRMAVRDLSLLLRSRGIGLQNTLLVGTGPAAVELRDTLSRRPHMGFNVLGHIDMPDEKLRNTTIPTIGTMDELTELVDRNVVDTVIFATSLEQTARYEQLIWKLEEVGTTVHLRGDAVGVLLSRTFIGEFQGMPILTIRSTPADPLALYVKRLIDLVASGLGMIAISPLLIATALAIKLTSKGPVFFFQERVGLNGRLFKMIKFRSMYMDAEERLKDLQDLNEVDGPAFKIKNDPRITPIGKWIRKFSVDELPQLWNVFVGEMSLVGPRPPIGREVADYQRWQRRRLSMKPGLTCLWQVSGRSNIDFETWMKLDMEYIDNWSLLLDAKILLKTIPVVVFAKGAH